MAKDNPQAYYKGQQGHVGFLTHDMSGYVTEASTAVHAEHVVHVVQICRVIGSPVLKWKPVLTHSGATHVENGGDG